MILKNSTRTFALGHWTSGRSDVPALLMLFLFAATVTLSANPADSTTRFRFPIQFVRNAGQWPAYVRFMMLPAENRVVFLDDGVMFLVKREKHEDARIPLEVATSIQVGDDREQYDYVIMRFIDPSPTMRIEAVDKSETMMHFYDGDSSTWREDVGCSRGIVYRDVWDGVDLHFRTDGTGMRQVITQAMGSAEAPRFRFEGEDDAVKHLQAEMHWRGGTDAGQTPVVTGDSLRFRIPDRIPTDSTYYWTEYRSFFNGADDGAFGMESLNVDIYGRLTIAGGVSTSDLPSTPNAYQRESRIGPHITNRGVGYFGRLRCDGTTPDYLTYYGIQSDSISVLPHSFCHPIGILNNQVIIAQHVRYGNSSLRTQYYPPTPDALEHDYPWEAPFGEMGERYINFLTRFDTTGRRAYGSTLAFRGWYELSHHITIGLDDHVYISGETADSLVYVRPGVFMDTSATHESPHGFLMKLSPGCDSVVYCTYLPAGTRVWDVAADTAGFASIIGRSTGAFPTRNAFQPNYSGTGHFGDMVVARFTPDGTSLVYATFLGGSYIDSDVSDKERQSICVSPGGDTYIAAITHSDDFPLYRPFQNNYGGDPSRREFDFSNESDMIVAGFKPDGQVLYSSYWGGALPDIPTIIKLTPCGEVLVVGGTRSPDYPIINPPAFSDTAAGEPTYLGTWNFMLLIDPSSATMKTSFRYPLATMKYNLTFDSAGYMHSIGWAITNVKRYNGFQRSIPGGDPFGTVNTYFSRQYFPLCGEDLLVTRPLIPDTIVVDSVRRYISHYEFTLAVELRNRDDRRSAINARSTIELPRGLVLVEGEPATKQPVPTTIPPGGMALVSWKVRLDTAKLGGWAGLRDLILHVKFTHEYQLSSALESCLTSFAWSDIPLYVKRKDSEITLVCDVVVTDTLRLSEDERGFIPPVINVSGVITNTGTAPAGPGTVALRLGKIGSHIDPPGDSLRTWPVLAPGDSWPVSWSVVPGKRVDPRTLLAEMVVMDEKGSITACAENIPVPAIPPLRCALQGPDTVRILKSGELVPPDIYTRILLSNVLDTLVGDAEVELSLAGVTHLRMWPGDTLRKFLGFVMPGGVRDARWQLELAQTPTRPTVVPVTVRYRCGGIRDWSECTRNIVLLPLTSDLLCSITAPAALSAAEVEARIELTLDYALRNAGLIPELVDRIDLTISPTAGVLPLDPLSQPGGTVAPSGNINRQWRLRPLALRQERTARFDVTAYGSNDSVLSVCTHDTHIPGIDGLLCDITAPDTVRFIRDELRYEPDPVPVTLDLRNILDTEETQIEAEIDLANAPRFELATGETAIKTLASIDSNNTAQLKWLLRPLPDTLMASQDITIRYRSLEQAEWKECNAKIDIEAWPHVQTTHCVVSGHDSLHIDPFYERIIPEPFEISYTATNTGTVALHNCAATIILPPEFELASGTATVDFGDLLPNNSITRWWSLKTTAALSDTGTYPLSFTWRSDEQGSVAGCEHRVHVIATASNGIVFTPLHLHFEAEQNDPIPAAQYVDLWTGGGLSMPWTAQGGQWWLDADPVSGDHAARIAVQPTTTALPIGLYATALSIAGQVPNLPKDIAVTYEITGLVGVAPSAIATTFGLGPVWPQPVPVNAEARISINVPPGEYVRLTIHDALGRETALLHEGAMPEQDRVLRFIPSAHRMSAGMYFLRLSSGAGQAVRAVMVRP